MMNKKKKQVIDPKCPLCYLINIIMDEYQKPPMKCQYCGAKLNTKLGFKTDIEVKMRTDCDCMVACLAMLMDWTYEESADLFPPKAVRETGYKFEWLMPYMEDCGVYLTWFDCKNINPDWSKPAIVDVVSLTAPDLGDHIIYWDGENVMDPSTKELKYTELPENIHNAYQINEKWTR